MLSNSKQTCRITGKSFILSNIEREVMMRIPDLFPELNGERIPFPTVHPVETCRRIHSYGSLRKLYRATNAISGTLRFRGETKTLAELLLVLLPQSLINRLNLRKGEISSKGLRVLW